MEGWIRSFVTSYGLRVASYAPQRLVCNILTRNPERETLQFQRFNTPILNISQIKVFIQLTDQA
jgi:hypothetical protein